MTYGDLSSPIALWTVSTPLLDLDVASVADLAARAPGEIFRVRQQGSLAISEPLVLGTLA